MRKLLKIHLPACLALASLLSSSTGLAAPNNTKITTHTLSLTQKKSSKLAQKKETLPDIAPIAPLPSVYREIQIDSTPSQLPIQIWKGTKQLDCLPSNHTPCKVRVVGFQTIPLKIIVRRGQQEFRFSRKLRGRNMSVERWFLPLPAATVIRRPLPRRRLPPPPKNKITVPPWTWAIIGVGVAGVATGVGVYLYNRNRVGFKCSSACSF